MKSIKPGRGPSLLSGIATLIGIAVIICFAAMAIKMRQTFFLIIAGFILLVYICFTIYHFSNAIKKNRHSILYIEDDRESNSSPSAEPKEPSALLNGKPIDGVAPRYCPYCGKDTESDFLYCKFCGRKLK